MDGRTDGRYFPCQAMISEYSLTVNKDSLIGCKMISHLSLTCLKARLLMPVFPSWGPAESLNCHIFLSLWGHLVPTKILILVQFIYLLHTRTHPSKDLPLTLFFLRPNLLACVDIKSKLPFSPKKTPTKKQTVFLVRTSRRSKPSDLRGYVS